MESSTEIVVAIIGAVGVILSAGIAALVSLNRRVAEIHILVNSRLTRALKEIKHLQKLLDLERDEE